MKDWFNKFITEHGDRIVFGFLATVFGVGIMCIGKYFLDGDQKTMGEGLGILIAVGGILVNKIRSTKKE